MGTVDRVHRGAIDSSILEHVCCPASASVPVSRGSGCCGHKKVCVFESIFTHCVSHSFNIILQYPVRSHFWLCIELVEFNKLHEVVFPRLISLGQHVHGTIKGIHSLFHLLRGHIQSHDVTFSSSRG